MDDTQKTNHRITKSYVRIIVTYFVVFTYCIAAVTLSLLLYRKGEYDLAIGVFNGLATLAAGIAGFWFGSRGNGFPEDRKSDDKPPTDPDDIFIGPEIGEDRFGNSLDPDDDEVSPPLNKD